MKNKIDPRLADKNWRIRNLYKIVNKEGKLVTYKPNVIQEQVISDPASRKIILKGRQHGITTHYCIDYLDDVLFTRHLKAVIIAHKEDTVKEIFKKIKLSWDNIDPMIKTLMQWEINADNANELSFTHGASMSVALSTRGSTVLRLHITEFGKMCAQFPIRAKEVITGALPSVPEKGRVTIESTAEGEVGYFADMFKEARLRGESETYKQFKAFFFGWQENPEYVLKGNFDIPDELIAYGKKHGFTKEQLNWYFIEMQTQKELMKQEYPTTWEEAFEVSGNKVFSLDALNQQLVKKGDPFGDWIQYEKFNPSHSYAMGADIAEGIGEDSSTAVIIDFKSGEVVAEYASDQIAPDLFAYELNNMSRNYGGCIIAPERNNHGLTTVTKLRELGANVYIDDKRGTTGAGKTSRYGWFTTGGTKPMMIYDLKSAIDEQDLNINSERILQEMKTYDKLGLDTKSKATQHWDLVIATAIAWQMRKNAYVNQTSSVLKDKLKKSQANQRRNITKRKF